MHTTESSTAITRIIESVKLNFIKVCGFSETSEAGSFCIRWVGDRCPDVCRTKVGTIYQPARGRFNPPANSLAGFWSTDDSEELEGLFSIESNDLSSLYIDIHVLVIYLDNASNADAQALTGVASFTGILSPGLPQAASGTIFSPVGLATGEIA
jgi:hypothetical protein